MRLLAYSALLSLSACVLMLPARAEDDVIVNGLHCNATCQSWLGAGAEAAKPAAGAEQPRVGQTARPPIASNPVRFATPSQPASARPVRVQMASREAGPVFHAPTAESTAVEMPVRRSLQASPSEASSTSSVASLGPGDRLEMGPPSIAGTTFEIPERRAAVRSLSRSSKRVTSAPVPQGEPAITPVYAAPEDATGAGPGVRARHQSAAAIANPEMERGLTTLPRLSDVVAVRGAVMIDTPEDRAYARRQMARLVKETTRPKDFRTGFADPLFDKPAANSQVLGQAH